MFFKVGHAFPKSQRFPDVNSDKILEKLMEMRGTAAVLKTVIIWAPIGLEHPREGDLGRGAALAGSGALSLHPGTGCRHPPRWEGGLDAQPCLFRSWMIPAPGHPVIHSVLLARGLA